MNLSNRIFQTIGVLLTGCASFAAQAADPAAPPPNVLFIAVDDLRDWVGCLGCNQIKTPNFRSHQP